MSTRDNLPRRSTYTEPSPFTRMSLTSGSRSSGPMGPRPRISSTRRIARLWWAPAMGGASGTVSSRCRIVATSSVISSSLSVEAVCESSDSSTRPWYHGTIASKRVSAAASGATVSSARGRLVRCWYCAPRRCRKDWAISVAFRQSRNRRLRRMVNSSVKALARPCAVGVTWTSRSGSPPARRTHSLSTLDRCFGVGRAAP